MLLGKIKSRENPKIQDPKILENDQPYDKNYPNQNRKN